MSDDEELERSLGLFETIAIAMGSMIGSGIFILPGVAFLKLSSPTVAFTFLLGGILTIPAALSAAELGTAIPESGGSYLYIERGMGPLLGTIAGIGNWLVLNFKTALALIGGVPYLIFVFPAIGELNLGIFEPIVGISVALTVLFTIINTVSSEGAGKAQNVIVVLMLIALTFILVGSTPNAVNQGSLGGLLEFDGGGFGFVATTALVFVSYAGVIKVTSVAEEIKNPGKNIPRGIILSLIITTVIYVLITYVTVTVVDITYLAENVAIADGGLASDGEGAVIAILAQETIGRIGAIVVVAAALLALASTANSGILSASRYPFSMARDNLAPERLGIISNKTRTPVVSILATGALVIVLVVFFPIDRVARLGGAFQIIVFVLVNLALIGFREGSLDRYDPDYTSPLYPYLQLFGIVSGLVLLFQLSVVAIVGSLAVVALSVVYYFVYVRDNLDREGDIKGEIRDTAQQDLLEETKTRLNGKPRRKIMVVANEQTAEEGNVTTQIAKSLETHSDEVVVDVVEVVESIKTSLDESHPVVQSQEKDWTKSYGNVEYTQIEAQNTKEAIVDYATYNGIDLIVHNHNSTDSQVSVLEDRLEWIVENAPCQTALVDVGELPTLNKVSVVSEGVFNVPAKILVADSICDWWGAHLELVHMINPDSTEEKRDSLEQYLDSLTQNLSSPSSYQVIDDDSTVDETRAIISDADMFIAELDISTVAQRFRGNKVVQLKQSIDTPSVMIYSEANLKYNTLARRLIMRYIFRGIN